MLMPQRYFALIVMCVSFACATSTVSAAQLWVAPVRNSAELKETEIAFLQQQVVNRLAAKAGAFDVRALSRDSLPLDCDEECVTSSISKGEGLLLFLEISRFGQGLALLTTVKDLGTGEVIESRSSQSAGIDDLIAAVETAADDISLRLSRRESAPPPALPQSEESGVGFVRFESTPSGAEVFIGGSVIDWGNIRCVAPCDQKLLPREYWVRAKLRFHTVWKQKAMVLPGKNPVVRINMVEDLNAYPPNPYKVMGHVLLWSGLSFGALGVVSANNATGEANHYNETFSPHARTSSKQWAGLMWGAFALSGVMIPCSIALFVRSPGDKKWWQDHQPQVGPTLDGKGATASLAGRF